jgi:hypothetical protein
MSESGKKKGRPTKPYSCEYCGESDEDKFYKSNHRKCKACISEEKKEKIRNETDEDKLNKRIYGQKYVAKNFFKERLRAAYHRVLKFNRKKKNKNKQQEFTLTEEEVRQQWEDQEGRCYYSGMKLKMVREKDEKAAGSIDRIDSSLGYTAENCVWVSKTINAMKQDMSADEFYSVVSMISGHEPEYRENKCLQKKLRLHLIFV